MNHPLHRFVRHLIVGFFVVGFFSSWAKAQEITAGPAEQLNTSASSLAQANSLPDWETFTGKVRPPDGTIWFRQQITLNWFDPAEANNPLALSVRVNGLYDAYWDGELIASNRHLGNRAPQNSRVLVPVPNLANGPHVLHLKITGSGLEAGENINLQIVPSSLSADFFGVHFSVVLVFFVTVSSYVASAYFLVISGAGNRVALCRSAATIMFLAGTLVFLDQARYLTPYPQSWQPSIDGVMAVMTVGFALALLAYGALRLNLKRALWWPLGILPVLALSAIPIGDVDPDVRAFFGLGMLMLAMCGLTAKREKKNAATLAAAILASLLILVVQPQEKIYFVAMITILFGIELGTDLYRRTQEAQRMALMSERLRGDLLRQNIKPHFLMNSLTALMEWIETNPPEAIKFIDGLAKEFRYLSDFSDRRSVSLKEELELCQVHLDLISRRLDAKLHLQTKLVDTSLEVPPALFHTLLENACSHNDYRKKNIGFTLRQSIEDTAVIYELSVPVIDPAGSALGTGIGTKYVKARLEEFCGNAFRFQSEQIGSSWRTIIKLNES